MPAIPTVLPDKTYMTATWTGETGNGIATDFSRYHNRKNVQRLGGTGTVTVEGSNDGTNWIALNNTANPTAAISLATGTNAAAGILEEPRYLRAVVAGGTATVTIIGYYS
jgi:hypothetical protein